MPNRIIKESIHTSEDVNKMTDFQFRLWISLITYVDDYGRGDARPAIIKGACFPLRDRITNKDIDAALNALAGIGCVGLYAVDGKPYLYFPAWESHQSIRNQKSRYPAPEEGNRKQLNAIEINCKQLNAIAPVIQSNTNPNPNPNPNTKVRVCDRPSLEEIEAYAAEKHLDVDAKAFYDYFTETNWVDSKGNKVKSWKGKLQTWSNFGSGRSGKQTVSYADSTVDMAELSRTLEEI